VDFGEDIGVPDDFSEEEIVSSMWWRHLVAGGVAGAVSRTCTAPLDRLKIMLQASVDVFDTSTIGHGLAQVVQRRNDKAPVQAHE